MQAWLCADMGELESTLTSKHCATSSRRVDAPRVYLRPRPQEAGERPEALEPPEVGPIQLVAPGVDDDERAA